MEPQESQALCPMDSTGRVGRSMISLRRQDQMWLERQEF